MVYASGAFTTIKLAATSMCCMPSIPTSSANEPWPRAPMKSALAIQRLRPDLAVTWRSPNTKSQVVKKPSRVIGTESSRLILTALKPRASRVEVSSQSKPKLTKVIVPEIMVDLVRRV
jgi:hypothetical protein